MPKFFVNQCQVENKTIIIKGTDVNHIKNVLRMKVGDKIQICIMQDISSSEENKISNKDTNCQIMKIKDDEILCNILEYINKDVESNIQVSIFQGLPKSDKMELIIQKSVELGAYDIYPVEMKRCVVKLTEQNSKKKILRWQKISEVAAKQCGRSIIPEIKEYVSINSICSLIPKYDKVIVAYEEEKNYTLKSELQNLKEKIKNESKNVVKDIENNKEIKKDSQIKRNVKIAVVIGPEGGLDIKDVKQMQDAGATVVSLGRRILRTETVALNVLSNIMYEFE